MIRRGDMVTVGTYNATALAKKYTGLATVITVDEEADRSERMALILRPDGTVSWELAYNLRAVA